MRIRDSVSFVIPIVWHAQIPQPSVQLVEQTVLCTYMKVHVLTPVLLDMLLVLLKINV